MKNTLIAMLLAVSLGLGAVCFWQASRSSEKLRQVQQELAQAKSELNKTQSQLTANAEANERAASVERSTKAVQDTLVKTSQFAKQKEREAADLQARLAAAKTNSNNPLAGVAKMFGDPKMRDLLKNSQKAVMGPMIEKQYGPLMKQLNLSDDDSAKLKTLLTDKMLSGANEGMALMDTSLNAGQRKEISAKIKAAQDDHDSQIKSFLGDDYTAFQNYEKTVPDRLAVSQFSDQLSGGLALSDDQTSQLIQAMADERTSFQWTTDYSKQKNPGAPDFASLFTEDRLDTYSQEKERFDQQFLDKAKTILSADQLAEFAAFQKSQRDMQIMGMKMAASMFGGQKSQ